MPAVRNHSRSELIRALENTQSLHSAARWLGISYPTFKNLTKVYMTDDGTKTLFEAYKNQSGLNTSKNARDAMGDNTIPTKHILEGKVPINHFTYNQIKNRLIRDGYILPKCDCGFEGKRKDGKRPLILAFMDGNRNNVQLENLKLVCYNCYFLQHGNLVVNHDQIPGVNTFIFDHDENDMIGHTSDILDQYVPILPDPNQEKHKYIPRYNI